MDAKMSIYDPKTPILIVDDNPQYTKVLTLILQDAFRYENITAVEEPVEGLRLVQEAPERFLLLFIDYNFPSGDTGADLLEGLYSAGLLEKKAAFLITSDPTSENLSRALKAGALGVVAKPFDREELKRQLEKAERHIITSQAETF